MRYLNWLFDDDNDDGDVININNRNRTWPILFSLFALSQPPTGVGQRCMHIYNFLPFKYITRTLEIKTFNRE